ncbi:dTMP kinase [Liquorilactobacillus vini]|uniref:Thymidylate kinase n=1 Tax=Liquorilactobacillus vini DSM 20605 TaxID=1133569 RepID=A0A0R2CAI1_9LACO|nr:dTMP kinase [Liquorilactobacillus vini]KRM88817.1 thymidylate kinase [Liquorilactobacillus vini DSM 20605]
MEGKFVTLEGLDGSGKTTVLRKLIETLNEQQRHRIVVTREPGGNQIAEKIRQLLLDSNSLKMDSRTEALLYAAARRQHLVENVLPALAAGKIIFCDRYVDSSIAYQGAGRQLGETAIAELNQFATAGLQADLTLYFDLPPQVGLQRINHFRQDQINRLDQEKIDFYQRVRASYLRLVAEEPKRVIKINAATALVNVVEQTRQILKEHLPELLG